MFLLCITLMLMPQPVTLEFRQYAKQYVVQEFDLNEWKCFNKIIYRESRWRHNAENGSHYGLGQIRNSKKYLEGKPRLQVRKTLEYIENRYKTPCRAYKHHLRRNWY